MAPDPLCWWRKMSRPISSLHCLFSYDNKLGGSVHAALNVCKYLAQAGQPVEMVASYYPGDDIGYLKTHYPDVKCHQAARSFPRRFSNSGELMQWLGRNIHRFDVVELHGIFVLTTLRAAKYCRERGIPYFVRPHGSLDPFDLQKHGWLKKIIGPLYVRWLLNHSAGVVCTAELEANRLVTYGAKPRRLVMPLPVPLSDQAGNGSAFRQRHGIPQTAKVVLFMSRIDYKKGLDVLIPALARVKEEFPELWFILAGGGTTEFETKVGVWLNTHKLGSWTRKVGFLSGADKLDALAAADIFALPSQNENFGIVLIEAMHAGVPLLISDEVYIGNEITKSGAGVACRPTTEEIAAGLRSFLSGQIDVALMGKCGRELVTKLYSPVSSTTQLLQVYQQVLRA